MKYYDIEVEVGDVNLVVYDTKTGTSNIPQFQNDYEHLKHGFNCNIYMVFSD